MNNIYSLLMTVFTFVCAICFAACGVLYIMYDMCPIVERVGTVGAVLFVLLVSHGLTWGMSELPYEDEEEEL